MTEHSIEELERQYQQARSTAEEALKASNAAKARLDLGRLEATGLNGHVVSYERRSWRQKEPQEIRFVVRKLGLWGDEVAGPILKKDGWPGEREARCSVKNLIDHGPYVGPQA